MSSAPAGVAPDRFPLEARQRFRDELRRGRASAQRNAEGFNEIVRAIERIARYRGARGHGMGAFKPEIEEIALASPLANEIPTEHAHLLESFAVLYDSTRIGRNNSVHEGAYARNLARHATQLALILEDAMQTTMRTVQHFMVREPTCAELWEPVALVRQKMLANSFSFLPVAPEDGRAWRLISDVDLTKYLRSEQRKERLRATLARAVDDGLKLRKAKVVSPDEPADRGSIS